jgi:hypothetical protein
MATSKTLEEQFESSKKLREFSEELKREKAEWQAYYLQALRDVEEAKLFLKEFRTVVDTYREVLEAFTDEMKNLKEYKRLVELTKQLVDVMRR